MVRISKYVIGLDDAHRFDSFYAVGPHVRDFKRFSAVDNRDGHVTDREFDYALFRRRFQRDPAPAEIGCILSHVKVWRDFVASGAEWALVAEDDALISPDVDRVVRGITQRYPKVQLVNLSDGYATVAGAMNPRMEYIRLSLLSPFIAGKYRMGKPYGPHRLTCTGLYLLSRPGAELLLSRLDKSAPGTVADDFRLYEDWGLDVRLVQPGLCGWEGSSTLIESGISHLEMLKTKQQGTGRLDRLRIALAPKLRLANARNILEATVEDVKRRLAR